MKDWQAMKKSWLLKSLFNLNSLISLDVIKSHVLKPETSDHITNKNWWRSFTLKFKILRLVGLHSNLEAINNSITYSRAIIKKTHKKNRVII